MLGRPWACGQVTGENEDKNEFLSHGLVMKTGQGHTGKVPGTKGVLSNWQWRRGSGRRSRGSRVTKGLGFIPSVALRGSQTGRGNETNFLTEREARPHPGCGA